jgi:hypothetical protein
MNLDTIRSMLLEDPFVPLEVRLANGDRHPVDDPFDVAVGKYVVMIAYPDSGRVATCTPHQIVSIGKVKGAEPRANSRKKQNGNGK